MLELAKHIKDNRLMSCSLVFFRRPFLFQALLYTFVGLSLMHLLVGPFALNTDKSVLCLERPLRACFVVYFSTWPRGILEGSSTDATLFWQAFKVLFHTPYASYKGLHISSSSLADFELHSRHLWKAGRTRTHLFQQVFVFIPRPTSTPTREHFS